MATNPITILINARDRAGPAFRQTTSRINALSKRVGGLSSVLLRVGPALAAGIAGIGYGLTSAVRNAVDFLGQIEESARQAGVPATVVQEWVAFANSVGVNAQTVGTVLRRLRRRFDDAINGSQETARIFAQLNIPLEDGAGNLRTYEAVVNDFRKRLAESSNEAGILGLALRLVDIEGAQLAAELIGSGDAFERAADFLRQYGAVLDEATVARVGEFAEKQDQLTHAMNAQAAAFGASLIPFYEFWVKDVAPGFLGWLSNLGAGFEDLTDNEPFTELRDKIRELDSELVKSERLLASGALSPELAAEEQKRQDDLFKQRAANVAALEALEKKAADRRSAAAEDPDAPTGVDTNFEQLAQQRLKAAEDRRSVNLAYIQELEKAIALEKSREAPDEARLRFLNKQLDAARKNAGTAEQANKAETGRVRTAEQISAAFDDELAKLQDQLQVETLLTQGKTEEAKRQEFINSLADDYTQTQREALIAARDQLVVQQGLTAGEKAKQEIAKNNQTALDTATANAKQDLMLSQLDLAVLQEKVTPLEAFLARQEQSLNLTGELTDMQEAELETLRGQWTQLFLQNAEYDRTIAKQQLIQELASDVGGLIANWTGSTDDWIGLLGRALQLLNQFQFGGENETLGGITSFLGAFGGGRQRGGPVSGGTSYLVGERGPEIFVPRSAGNIVPNNRISSFSMNMDVTMNNPVLATTQNLEQVKGLLVETVQNAVGQAKQEMFYGRTPTPYGGPR